MASSILVLLYVHEELSYDRHHEKADRIYRMRMKSSFNGTENRSAITAPPLAPTRGAGWLLALAAAYGVVWLGLSPQMRLFTHGLGLLAAAAAAGWLGVRRRGGAAAVVASAAMGELAGTENRVGGGLQVPAVQTVPSPW